MVDQKSSFAYFRARGFQGRFYGNFLYLRYCLNIFLLNEIQSTMKENLKTPNLKLGGKSETDSVLSLLTWFSLTRVTFAAVIYKFILHVFLFCLLCWFLLPYIFQCFCLYSVLKLGSLCQTGNLSDEAGFLFSNISYICWYLRYSRCSKLALPGHILLILSLGWVWIAS